MKNTKTLWICIIFLLLIPISYSKTLEVIEGDIVSLNVSAEDLDGDELIINYTPPLNENGEWQTNLGDAGSYSSKITVSDGKSISEQNVTIIVNKLPLPEFQRNYNIREGERLEVELPSNMTLSDLPDDAISNNKFVWTPDYHTVKPDMSFVEKFLFKWRISNKIDLNKTKSFTIPSTLHINNLKINDSITINVINNNRAPYFVNLSEEINVKEGERLKIKYFVEDLDEDKLFVSFSGFINKNNQIIGYDKQGGHNVTVEVSDGQLSQSKEVKVNVIGSNRYPGYRGDNNIVLRENQTKEIKLLGYDLDSEVSFDIKSGLNISKIVNNTLIVNPDFDFVVYPDKKRHDVIILDLDDGNNKIEQNISLTVRNVNRKVKIVGIYPPQKVIVKRGEVVKFEINAEDLDNGNLTYYWSEGWGWKEGEKNHYRKMESLGVKKFKVKVSDGESSDKFEWKILVK